MSQKRISWNIEDFIAPGTPLTGELLAYSESLPGSRLSDSRTQQVPFIFWALRLQDRYSPKFNDYCVRGKQIKHMTVQFEMISDKGALLSRTSLSFSDLVVSTIQHHRGDEQFTEQLAFEGREVSRLHYGN